MASVRVRQEGTKVLMVIDGRASEMPPEAARLLARALIEKAAAAEELARVDSVILDSALLLRIGVPIGLTKHPKILEEARKEAVTNRDLRRYAPGGVRSSEQFGAPRITQTPPPEKKP